MMKHLICRQEKALKGRILITILVIFSFAFLFTKSESLTIRILFFVTSLIVFGFSVSYKINEDFINEKLYSVFGLVLFKTKLDLEFPDYISVFSGSFSVNNEWATVSAIGTKERHENIVVRFFTENRKTTLYKTNDYKKAIDKANGLKELLEVDIYDMTKS